MWTKGQLQDEKNTQVRTPAVGLPLGAPPSANKRPVLAAVFVEKPTYILLLNVVYLLFRDFGKAVVLHPTSLKETLNILEFLNLGNYMELGLCADSGGVEKVGTRARR